MFTPSFRHGRTLRTRKALLLAALMMIVLVGSFIPTMGTPFEWQRIAGPQIMAGGPAIIPWTSNLLSFFGRNSADGDVMGLVMVRPDRDSPWHERSDWPQWLSMGFDNAFVSDVDCLGLGIDDRVGGISDRGHCVGLGEDGNIVHFTCRTGPCPDKTVPGDRPIVSKPTIVKRSIHSFRVLAVDAAGNLVMRNAQGSFDIRDSFTSFGPWEVVIDSDQANLGAASHPECVSTGLVNETIHCFVVGRPNPDSGGVGHLLHTVISTTDGWSGVWNHLGGELHSGISAVSVDYGHQIHVYVEGPPDEVTPVTQLWRIVSYDDGLRWGAWETLGGDIMATPDCVQLVAARIHCLAHGPFDAMWFNSFAIP